MKSISSDKNVPVPPLVEKELHPGWYWLHGEPVYVFVQNDVLVARWYNFSSKEEYRKPVSEMDQSALVSIHLQDTHYPNPGGSDGTQ